LRRDFVLLTLVLMTGQAHSADLSPTNWKNHPDIVSIRRFVETFNSTPNLKTRKERHEYSWGNDMGNTHHLLNCTIMEMPDHSGTKRIAFQYDEANDDEYNSSANEKVEIYFDKGVLKFIYTHGWANGSYGIKGETRYYSNESGIFWIVNERSELDNPSEVFYYGKEREGVQALEQFVFKDLCGLLHNLDPHIPCKEFIP
jgi:hypothetical protein